MFTRAAEENFHRAIHSNEPAASVDEPGGCGNIVEIERIVRRGGFVSPAFEHFGDHLSERRRVVGEADGDVFKGSRQYQLTEFAIVHIGVDDEDVGLKES